MSGLWRDLKYGARMLRRNPGFTAAAVLSLALGFGANIAIFSVVNAVLMRPPQVAEPDRLVRIWTGLDRGSPYSGNSYADYQDVRDRTRSFSGVAAHFDTGVSLKARGQAEALVGSGVTANYFQVLGVGLTLGRDFTAEEDTQAVAVISHAYWKRACGSDPGILGAKILVNGYPAAVVGVAPEGFTGTFSIYAVDVWFPVLAAPRFLHFADNVRGRANHWLWMVGRLKPGVGVGETQAELATLASALRQQYPETNAAKRFTILKLARSRVVGQPVPQLDWAAALLMGMAGLVLLITCSNVVNLLLARAVDRQREMALRLALGGGRTRILRQVLAESVLLAAVAGAAGVLLALWVTPLIDEPAPKIQQIQLSVDLGLDWRVLGYALLLATLTGLLLGLLPALRSSSLRLCAALREPRGLGVGSPRRSRLQSGLVTAQVALSLALLIGAGLSFKSLLNVLAVDPGFDVNNILLADMNLTHVNYDEQQGREFFRRLVERVEQLPGVRSASLAFAPPFPVARQMIRIRVDDYEPAKNEDIMFFTNVVGARYFETFGIPMLEGRGFDERDRADTLPVVVVNEVFARRFWPGRQAVGRTLRRVGEDPVRVVGVAKNTKFIMLTEAPQPYVYFPLAQNHVSIATLHVKTSGSPQLWAEGVLREIRALDPTLPVETRPISEQMRFGASLPKTMTVMVAGFGMLALALAMVGSMG